MAVARPDKERGERARPLHGGRHSLLPTTVAFDQRERILGALAAAVADSGYNKVTISQITERASVSRRTFYEMFSGKQEAFLVTYDALDEYLVSLAGESVSREVEWPDRVATTLAATIAFLAERPDLARVYLVETVVVGGPMVSRLEARAERCIELLAPGRGHRDGGREPAEGIEEAVFGGIVTLLARRIVAGEGERLTRFTPAVIEFALAPYLGMERARELAAAHG